MASKTAAQKEKINEKELLSQGWIKAWLMFEVQSLDKSVCEKALKAHVEKLLARNDVKSSEITFGGTEKVDLPEKFKEALEKKGIKNLFSQISEVTLFVKNFESLLNVVITYGPTAIEINAPDKIVLNLREAQGALANVADMMHKFAAAGIGGMLVSGE
jgi:hypothetical protein